MSKSDTRTRILEAAGPIFAEKGFESATIRDICQAADVNVASVNYHFGDKEHLYLETMRYAQRLRDKQVPHASYEEIETPVAQLQAFVKTMLSRVLGVNALPWQASLMMREVLDPTDACRDMVEGFFRPQLEELQRIISPLLPTGLSRAKRMQIAFSIMGQCLFYRFAGKVAEMLSASQSRSHYEIDALSGHITEFTLAAFRGMSQPKSSPESKTKRGGQSTAKAVTG